MSESTAEQGGGIDNQVKPVDRGSHPPTAGPSEAGLGLYSITETPEGVTAILPSAFTEHGLMGTQTQSYATREEADRDVVETRARMGGMMELASLRRSFSSTYAIDTEYGGSYSVTFPGLRFLDEPDLYFGTSNKSFNTWEEARDFYLETYNNREYPHDAVFTFGAGDLAIEFTHMDSFGRQRRLSDKALEVSDETKAELDFDARNDPETAKTGAYSYARTKEIPGWEGEIFHFVETFSESQEGQQLFESLGITDLRLLTTQQAARLSLEMVTQLKKYNRDEMEVDQGDTASDKRSAIALLRMGLQNRDDTDFKGNGICRNFASSVKAVFEGLKTNQTKFNYLQDTYCFYESGPRSDFDPTADMQSGLPGESMTLSLDFKPQIGHAWNSFVTIGEEGVSQSIVDATWSNFDYDTQESVALDYTLERMERDVYRILKKDEVRKLKREPTQIDPEQGAQFYLFLVDSLSQQAGLVLDDEAKIRARNTALYKSSLRDFEEKYPGGDPDRYDQAALEVYRIIVNQQSIQPKTEFYLGRAVEGIRKRESEISPDSATALTQLLAEKKQAVTYYDVDSVYALPTERVEDRRVVAKKYVDVWERANEKGNAPIWDLIFSNKEAQAAIMDACNPKTKEALLREIAKRIK